MVTEGYRGLKCCGYGVLVTSGYTLLSYRGVTVEQSVIVLLSRCLSLSILSLGYRVRVYRSCELPRLIDLIYSLIA